MAGPRKFLVVDEALTVTRRTGRYLEQAGIDRDRILEVVGREAALQLFQAHLPEVVVVSQELPDGQGHEVAVEMLERDPRTSIVLSTASPQQDPQVQEALREGVQGVLRKPVGEADVQDMLTVLGEESPGRTRIPPPQ